MAPLLYVTPIAMGPSTTSSDTNPPRSLTPKRPRKPPGYWANLDNIRSEIVRFNEQTNASNPHHMPTKNQLRTHGRRDLDNAISKSGGYSALAAKLSLQRQTNRKPPGFWASFPNLDAELRSFLASDDAAAIEPGLMPTLKELRDSRRSDIAEGIEQHGGVRAVTNRMRLRARSSTRPRGHWDDWAQVEVELLAFMRTQARSGEGATLAMPTQRELRNAGRADLADALALHGGLRAAAARLGVQPRKRRDFYYASFANVARELYTLADAGAMPTTATLRAARRTNLLTVVRRFGGLALVARRLGLQYQVRTRESFRDWQTFRRQLLSFVDIHGEQGAMPSSRKLANFGRDDLYMAILHHGGMRAVADRLTLRIGYLQEFAAVAVQVLDFIEVHGTPGVMPTERDLLDLGRGALNVAISKFGYSQVAQRLGLKEPAQSSQVALEAFLSSAISVDDEEDECCQASECVEFDELEGWHPKEIT